MIAIVVDPLPVGQADFAGFWFSNRSVSSDTVNDGAQPTQERNIVPRRVRVLVRVLARSNKLSGRSRSYIEDAANCKMYAQECMLKERARMEKLAIHSCRDSSPTLLVGYGTGSA